MKQITVEVYGGNVTAVHGLPEGYEWQLLDWDNLLPDDCYTKGQTQEVWDSLGTTLQDEVKRMYPDDYAKVLKRIAEDVAA